MGIPERIRELEDELRNTQYNKATEHHFGVVRAKIARLRDEAEKRAIAKAGTGGGDPGWSVKKSGDASVILVGFPSVGKSTLLNKVTGAKSKTAAYEFTTLTIIPGVFEYNHAKIQVLDVPGILQGASTGRGRGKEVLGAVRACDLVIILIDALQPQAHPVILEELYNFGIRVNQKFPNITITRKERGGIVISKTVPVTRITDELITSILREFRMNSVDILLREDINAEQLIDALEHNRKYAPAITVVTKIDLISPEQYRAIQAQIHPDIAVSAHAGYNVDNLKKLIFERLDFMRVFLKERTKAADMDVPMIMTTGSTLKDVCDKIHRDFIKKFKYARLWGSAKFPGQIIRKLDRVIMDKDVLEIHLK